MRRLFLLKAAMLILTVALTSACEDKKESFSSNAPEPSNNGSADFIQCEDDRPTICTQIYKPVCGSIDTGIRCVTTPCPSVEFKTYGNACHACADNAVEGFIEGECPDNSDNSSSSPTNTNRE